RAADNRDGGGVALRPGRRRLPLHALARERKTLLDRDDDCMVRWADVHELPCRTLRGVAQRQLDRILALLGDGRPPPRGAGEVSVYGDLGTADSSASRGARRFVVRGGSPQGNPRVPF